MNKKQKNSRMAIGIVVFVSWILLFLVVFVVFLVEWFRTWNVLYLFFATFSFFVNYFVGNLVYKKVVRWVEKHE